MLIFLCHMDLHSLVSIFRVLLSEACNCSSFPIVCACFVVACCRVIPRISVTSSITWDMNTDLLPEMMVVGKQACLVMILFITLASLFAS